MKSIKKIRIIEYIIYAIVTIAFITIGVLTALIGKISVVYVVFQVYVFGVFMTLPLSYLLIGAVKEYKIMEYSMPRYATIFVVFTIIIGTVGLYAFYHLETISKFNSHWPYYFVSVSVALLINFIVCLQQSKKPQKGNDGPKIVRNR